MNASSEYGSQPCGGSTARIIIFIQTVPKTMKMSSWDDPKVGPGSATARVRFRDLPSVAGAGDFCWLLGDFLNVFLRALFEVFLATTFLMTFFFWKREFRLDNSITFEGQVPIWRVSGTTRIGQKWSWRGQQKAIYETNRKFRKKKHRQIQNRDPHEVSYIVYGIEFLVFLRKDISCKQRCQKWGIFGSGTDFWPSTSYPKTWLFRNYWFINNERFV